ncbi:MAG: hypothetical protein JNM09_02625 [Blastocatellia bacterium]|nr:hypothetical protein [Blastocatellia bacterium]
MRESTYRLISPEYFFVIAALSLPLFSTFIFAQTPPLPNNLRLAESAKEPAHPGVATPRVATGKDLYCAGYIRATQPTGLAKIIGAEEEQRVARLGQGDVVYINAGRSQNIRPDTLFSITRPMGNFRSPYQRTGGKDLGVFVRELGVLRVIEVQGQTAIARIVVSCDDVQLGDLLVNFEERTAPETDVREPLPRYQPTSGQKPGRIVLQREQRENIGPRDVVYVDLGAENGVKVGDKFTIFRNKPDDANLFNANDDDIVVRQSGGFESDKFKGGKFSGGHPYEARQQVKNTRGAIPQKIVGELVVIAVEGKAATAIVTRTTQEIHTGDHIEALR